MAEKEKKTMGDLVGKVGSVERDKEGQVVKTYGTSNAKDKSRVGSATVVHHKVGPGGYTESTGGGTPLKRGEKLKDHPEAHRVDQPRDEDGQFTYNSANKLPLKYGPSRGETPHPALRDLTITFAKKTGKGSIVDKDGKVWRFSKLGDDKIGPAEFLDSFKEYVEGEGFGKFGELDKKLTRRGPLTFASRSEKVTEDPGARARKTEEAKFVGKWADMKEFWGDYKSYKERAEEARRGRRTDFAKKSASDDSVGGSKTSGASTSGASTSGASTSGASTSGASTRPSAGPTSGPTATKPEEDKGWAPKEKKEKTIEDVPSLSDEDLESIFSKYSSFI